MGGLIMAVLACFFFGIIGGKIGHIFMGIVFLLLLIVGGGFMLLTAAGH